MSRDFVLFVRARIVLVQHPSNPLSLLALRALRRVFVYDKRQQLGGKNRSSATALQRLFSRSKLPRQLAETTWNITVALCNLVQQGYCKVFTTRLLVRRQNRDKISLRGA